jgi:UDP-glucose 4-epimerase
MGIKEEAVGEAINLGSGKEHRVIDLANKVNELTGNEAGIKYVERRDWDVKSNF